MIGNIGYSPIYAPNVNNPNQTWVFMDDEYSNQYSNATSGALLLPSIATVVNGDDPNNFYLSYQNDIANNPEARSYLAAILLGVLAGGKEVVFCPGNSPAEVFIPHFLNILFYVYGVVVTTPTTQFSVNPAYCSFLANEFNMYLNTSVTPETVLKWVTGTEPISPFSNQRRMIENDNICKAPY